MRGGKLLFEVGYMRLQWDRVATDWVRLAEYTRHNDVFLDDSAQPLQFNYRSNFHQIIDGCGQRERQDNTGE